MIRKLRLKFICINMAIVTAMLAIIFTLLFFFMGVGMELEGHRAIQQITELVQLPDGKRENPKDLRRPYFAIRVGVDGSIVAVNRGYFEEMDQKTLLDLANQALAQEKTSGMLRQQQLRYQVLTGPVGQLVVFADISGEINMLQSLLKICVLVGIVSFAGFLLISIALANWAVGPVEKAWKQQRQFVADASHELKTPLTVITTNAELLQSGEYGPEDQTRFSRSILIMARQMRGLVEGLLELARVDNGAAAVAMTRLELGPLVEESLLPFEAVLFEKGLLLDSQVEAGIFVKGSASHLRQVVEILLDNAGKYSAPGGCVAVTLQRQGNHCLLCCRNPGEPIGQEELAHIFERFYRADKARTLDGSYGLGLSIAKGIVEDHGGKIRAESHAGCNSFLVQLPMV